MTLLVLLALPFVLVITITGLVAFVLPLLYGMIDEFKYGIGSGLFAVAIYSTLVGILLFLLCEMWYVFYLRCIN